MGQRGLMDARNCTPLRTSRAVRIASVLGWEVYSETPHQQWAAIAPGERATRDAHIPSQRVLLPRLEPNLEVLQRRNAHRSDC